MLDCAQKVYQNRGNLPLLDALPLPARVLDCGCGAGDNARILAARGCAVTGITISAEERALAEPFCERVLLADLEQGLPAGLGSYDIVLLSHVLEHLRAPERLLHDAAQLLRPSGLLAVALPNVLTIQNRLAMLGGSFEYTQTGIMDATHVRFYTFASAARMLHAHGYALTRSWAQGYFPLGKLRALTPPPLIERLNRESCARWPGLFGMQLLYLARRSEDAP